MPYLSRAASAHCPATSSTRLSKGRLSARTDTRVSSGLRLTAAASLDHTRSWIREEAPARSFTVSRNRCGSCHAPADEHVEIDVLLLAGEELGRAADCRFAAADRSPATIDRAALKYSPASVKVRSGRPNCVTITNWVSSTNSRQRQATARRTSNNANRSGFFMVS